MTEFRAPSAKVRAELEKLFSYVGTVNIADGEPMEIEDIFLLILDKYGPEIAAQCQIEVMYH
jgi:hypothetical protein